MKKRTKRLTLIALSLLVVLGATLYQSGTLEALQGRFGGSYYTRAQTIKLLVVDTGVPVVSSTTKCTFTDITGSEWYASYFYTACEEGWLSFYGATAVEPNSTWNKAEVSKIAYLAYGLTESLPGSATYTDVAEGDWYYSYIETLAMNSAYSSMSGAFYPYKVPTRTWVDYMLSRL